MKKSILVLILSFAGIKTPAQPAIQWESCFGGTLMDQGYAIQQTSDGGYIAAGLVLSTDGDVTGHHWNINFIDNYDFWVLKLDNSGTVQWKKCLGGGADENAHAIQQTTDGGYIVAGDCGYDDADVSGANGDWDYWVVKLNDTGAIQWQKPLGGSLPDWGKDVKQTADGGYIVAGYASSNDSDVTGNHGGTDFWIIKMDASGSIQWQKCYGGSGAENAYRIIQTTDGGYVAIGKTNSSNGDVIGHHGSASQYDYWIIKIDGSGILQWQKCLGGTLDDEGQNVIQTFDGGYLVVGNSKSSDGDVTLNHGNTDFWIVRLDATGTVQWQKALGGTNGDIAYSVLQSANGDFIIAGMTGSNDGDVTGSGSHGSGEYWVIRLDPSGNMVWKKCYGGSNIEWCYAINPTSDGGYILNGRAHSGDGDVSGLHNADDLWIVKLGPDYVGMDDIVNASLYFFPNPASSHLFFSAGGFNRHDPVDVKVYDLTGRSIISLELSGEQLSSGYTLDISSVPISICTIAIEQEPLRIFKKLLVVR